MVKKISIILLLVSAPTLWPSHASAEICPSVQSVKNEIPQKYIADTNDGSVQKSVTEWSHAEYSTLRERVFCHYASSTGDWSINTYVGDISLALRGSTRWKEGQFDGGSFWVCQSTRNLCEFSTDNR